MASVIQPKDIEGFAQRWTDLTGKIIDKVVGIDGISKVEAQELLLETYEKFYLLQKEEMVPKETTRIILAMNSFMDMLIRYEEEDELTDFCQFHEIYPIIDALQQGFLRSNYKAEFPKLAVRDLKGNEFIIDLKNDQLFI